MVWNFGKKDNCHFVKQNRCFTFINYLSKNFCRIIFLAEFLMKFVSSMWGNWVYLSIYFILFTSRWYIFWWQVCYCSSHQSNCLSINFERQLDSTASWPPNIIDFTISRGSGYCGAASNNFNGIINTRESTTWALSVVVAAMIMMLSVVVSLSW